MDMGNRIYTDTAFLNGQEGVLVCNGVYKMLNPFRINCIDWANDKDNRSYAIVGTNYSNDYKECDVIYFTNHDYGYLGNLVCDLNEKEPDRYGYIQCIYGGADVERLGGLMVEV